MRSKKKVVIQYLTEKFGLVPKSKHQRITLQLADKLKTDIHNFYQRDDISYQLPDKRDTVVVKDDDGKKVTYQKRILINNLRETYEFFKDENKSIDLSRSSFADLRLVFVVSKSALAHRNCLCVYHENVRLLLKDVDKYVDGTHSSSLSTFTDSLHLAEKFGLAPKSKHQRITLQLANKLNTGVHNFYQRDDISYQLPGKRDTVVVKDDDGKKVTYQKRILINNLRETYEFFKDENKSVDLSRSSFADLRPVFVFSKSALAHRNWLCVYHENVRLLLKDVDKYVDGTQCSSLSTFTDSLVCSTNNEECMFGCCSICKDFFSENIQENVSNSNSKITWSQWARENGRVEKKEFSGSVDEAILMFKSKIEFFLFHVYIKREQSKYFEKLKTEVIDEKILLQVDFAENFNMKEQDEIQSAHWNTKPLSIFTAFVWSKSKSFSFALPSLDLTHDKFVANAALKIILNHIETVLPNVLEVNCFSDGAASQFKQRFLFRNLMQSNNERKIKLSWNFFATSHGKGVVDGIWGGDCKTSCMVCRTGRRSVSVS
ncbi:unnamed protein product [Rotaria socialis]|uniref:Uncharacterized protein n=2 Tax=Rotaria socialis TaxID=392032 RepID=A0A818B014_9BILA|nr:unnamed protein product [Rotaria socialis]